MEKDCAHGCPIADEGVKCGRYWSRHCQTYLADLKVRRDEIVARADIRTEHVYPPIPVRQWDWSAIDHRTYDEGAPIGWGPTKQAAIDDLIEQLLDQHD